MHTYVPYMCRMRVCVHVLANITQTFLCVVAVTEWQTNAVSANNNYRACEHMYIRVVLKPKLN